MSDSEITFIISALATLSYIFVAKAECLSIQNIRHLKMAANETVKQDFTPFHV
jgi:hypothetical protein